MPLYLLEHSPDHDSGSPLDQTHSLVVRAFSETAARELASGQAGDEGAKFWFDTLKSTCKRISESGPTEILHKGIR